MNLSPLLVVFFIGTVMMSNQLVNGDLIEARCSPGNDFVPIGNGALVKLFCTRDPKSCSRIYGRNSKGYLVTPGHYPKSDTHSVLDDCVLKGNGYYCCAI